jgi:hypothetical protein
MVLITPQLVRPLDPDEVPPLPTTPDTFIQRPGDVGSQLEGPAGVTDPSAPSSTPDNPR